MSRHPKNPYTAIEWGSQSSATCQAMAVPLSEGWMVWDRQPVEAGDSLLTLYGEALYFLHFTCLQTIVTSSGRCLLSFSTLTCPGDGCAKPLALTET